MKSNLLKKHAKSFYWASFFLSSNTLEKCSSLYNFCRTLDDIVDDDSKLENKKENFNKFKKDFLNKNLNNLIVKEMWSIIDSENISKSSTCQDNLTRTLVQKCPLLVLTLILLLSRLDLLEKEMVASQTSKRSI